MSKINVLSSDIYNLIAAGEVVERPSSIIKELVENSIDAGADSITVEIKEGGIKYIKVSDNGSGIEKDDLKNALLSHATSKITKKDDLNAISTLGFRGEALASISAVSKLKILSRTSSSDLGYEISSTGGKISEITEKGSPLGTIITVEDLFFNVPARAKFLGKPSSEENHVTNYISRLILANPNISIKYIVNDKIIYQFSGKGIEAAIYTIYGKEALDNCLYVSSDNPNLKVVGYLGNPNYTKANRTYQTVIINGRYVNNETVSIAVHNAYQDKLMKRQYPFYVLYLTIPFDKVDVNVHPNKLDVRFWDKSYIFKAIFSAIRNTLNKNEFIKEIKEEPLALSEEIKQEETLKPKVNESLSNSSIDLKYNERLFDNTIKSSNFVRDDGGRMSMILNKLAEMKKSPQVQEKSYQTDIFNRNEKAESNTLETKSVQPEIFETAKKPIILGVLFDTYIMIEMTDNLYIMDQHAAHERLLFDRFIKDIENNINDIQDLLVPYIFKVNHLENNKITEMLDELNAMGFGITEFGNLTYKISTVPFLLSDINIKDFINEILNENTKNINTSDLLRDKIASAACKAAIKAGDTLKDDEIMSLINQLNENKTELLCPHGRPIITKINKKEIEKWFKRVI
ncbi:MAG TPA: DNA mismatch repair endonuclease MutL [Clostridia bacterium]